MINNIDPEINSPRRRPDQSRSRDGGSRGASRRKAGTWTCLRRAFAEINWSCYIDNIDRSRFSTSAGVELRFPEPDLPEPPPPETGGTSDTSDDTGTRVTAKNVGTFIKSVNGTISAPFGDKCGHKGLDIAARDRDPHRRVPSGHSALRRQPVRLRERRLPDAREGGRDPIRRHEPGHLSSRPPDQSWGQDRRSGIDRRCDWPTCISRSGSTDEPPTRRTRWIVSLASTVNP
jgi:hypothetical protein